jgi:hypothetical protein
MDGSTPASKRCDLPSAYEKRILDLPISWFERHQALISAKTCASGRHL